MSKATSRKRDSRGRFLPRAAVAPVVETAPLTLLAIGCERLDPIPALRREVFTARLAPVALAPALVRHVPTRQDLRRAPGAASWAFQRRFLASFAGAFALIAPLLLLGYFTNPRLASMVHSLFGH